jgi:molecular chaperone GrpE
MSDPAPPVRPDGPAPDAAAPLTPTAIERILADFRTWLTDLATPVEPTPEPPAVDLHTLVAQFTALRHEINLQTKAARTSIEQSGEALKTLEGAVADLRERPVEQDDEAGPLLKALVDVYDNLALALRQVERQRAAINGPLDEWVNRSDDLWFAKSAGAEPADTRGTRWRTFLALVGIRPIRTIPRLQAAAKGAADRYQQTAEAAKSVRSSFDGLIAGYQMSLARIDRAIEQAGLETIATVGDSFDPELMEVVEVVGDSGRPVGEVLEDVRRGYLRGDVVYRYAQVKVAR